jgi:uncharacterized repeat protein (TIGR03803 family)
MRGLAVFIAMVTALSSSGSVASAPPPYTVLHSFCAQSQCADGANPAASVVLDSNGDIFGTTQSGGHGGANSGTVFEIPHLSGDRFGRYKILHNFCTKQRCPDGAQPAGNLIIDKDGNLYGTTLNGAFGQVGNVFELRQEGGAWTIHVIYRFPGDGSSGATPHYLTYAAARSGVPYDGSSPLYVTAASGGAEGGTVLRLMPGPGEWHPEVIYQFCQKRDQTNPCLDGQSPNPGLAFDESGNIYGTTMDGGDHKNGTIFELSPPAKKFAPWPEIVLYSFCSKPNCADGAAPASGVVMDAQGKNLFGATPRMPVSDGGSVLYKFVLQDANPYNVLHSFCTQLPCSDGADAHALPAVAPSGSVFGTTGAGGAKNDGTLYQYQGTQYSTLYSFCALANCADGSQPSPWAPQAIVASGNNLVVFGTTVSGGAFGKGVVYGAAYKASP